MRWTSRAKNKKLLVVKLISSKRLRSSRNLPAVHRHLRHRLSSTGIIPKMRKLRIELYSQRSSFCHVKEGIWWEASMIIWLESAVSFAFLGTCPRCGRRIDFWPKKTSLSQCWICSSGWGLNILRFKWVDCRGKMQIIRSFIRCQEISRSSRRWLMSQFCRQVPEICRRFPSRNWSTWKL